MIIRREMFNSRGSWRLGSQKQKFVENYSREVIINGIEKRDNDVVRWLYLRVYHYLESFISRRNGTPVEALDVFHEGMLQLFENLRDPAVQVKKNIPEYLFGICRHLWYRYYHDASRYRGIPAHEMDLLFSSGEEPFPVFSERRELRYLLYVRYLPSLDMKCRRLLEMYLDKRSTEAIRVELSYHSRNSVYKKKFGCLRKLVDLMQHDPDYAYL